MKFKITVSDLQKSMRVMRDIAPSSGPLALEAGVKIVVKEDTATFYTFGNGLMAVSSVKVNVISEGTAVVDPGAMYSAISHFKEDKDGNAVTGEITVLLAPKANKLQISAITRYASGVTTPHKRIFPIKAVSGFLKLPGASKVKNKFQIPAALVSEAVDSVGYAVSADQLNMMFTGILVVLEDNKLTMFATNGVCLAEYTVATKHEGEPIKIIVPGALAQKIAKLFPAEKVLSCILTKGMLYVSSSDLTVGGSLIGDTYPDYKAVLPKPTHFVDVDKDVLLDNLISLTYEASLIDDSRVTVLVEGGEVFLRCNQSENRGIPSKGKGSMTFDCNLKLLAGSIKNVFGDIVTIGFAGKDTPLTFSGSTSVVLGSLSSVLVPLTT